MHKGLLAVTTALAALLFACGGSASSQDGAGALTGASQAARTSDAARAPTEPPAPAPAAATTPAATGAEHTSEVAIGVQPVPNTPIFVLPVHVGHTPLVQSPPEPAPKPPAPAAAPTTEWYVSVNGDDAAAGSSSAPFRTIAKAVSVAGPGALVHVGAGTYAEKIVLGPNARAGLPDAKITLQGEGKPKLVPVTAGTGGMVQFRQPNWVVDGFEVDVQGKAQYAAEFSGNVEGSVLANSDLHHGTLGGGVTTYGGATGAVIENNHIHDFSRGGVDSHGVVIQTTSKNITLRSNDIHNNSGDSVQCLGPEGFNNNAPADGLLIENNHLYANRENGVDVKTCRNVTIRENRIHGFRPTTTAKGDAIVVHYSAANVTIYGNDIFDASKGISIGGNHVGPVPKGIVIQKNRIHDIVTASGGEGSGIRIENSEGAKVLNNTLTKVQGSALVLGHGTGGPTSNLTVKNNIVAGAKLVDLGNAHPGLAMDNNLYAPSEQPFLVASVPTTFADWKGQGLDAASQQGDPAFQPGETLMPGQAAVDHGADVGLPFCGGAPDVGAVETGC